MKNELLNAADLLENNSETNTGGTSVHWRGHHNYTPVMFAPLLGNLGEFDFPVGNNMFTAYIE